MEKNAYFIHPIIVELAREADPQKRKRLKKLLAVNISSQEALKRVLGIDAVDMSEFYPDMQAKHPTTEATIDGFLDRFGNKGPETVDTLLEQNGVSDYFATRGTEGYVPDIDTEPDEAETQPMESESDEVHGDLTTGFAKILIKNGNYTKALEIIREINLKNPEKSIYFADQIRFIKKLMLNEAKKKSKTT